MRRRKKKMELSCLVVSSLSSNMILELHAVSNAQVLVDVARAHRRQRRVRVVVA